MKISDKAVVNLSYELYVDGKIVDTVEENNPIDYIQGMDMLIPKFEQLLEGKQEGESFDFVIEAEEGYGKYEENYKFDIPKSSFEIDGKVNEEILKVDNILPMLNSHGEVVKGTIVEIKEEAVTMDFNHPLAGKDLNFKGKIISVRLATEKELTEGLHGEFLESHCGCSCGGHHHEEHECCGGHHHGEHECCGGHHHGEHECCGGHHHGEHECCGGHHHEEHECACSSDCSCGCQEGEECSCDGSCNS